MINCSQCRMVATQGLGCHAKPSCRSLILPPVMRLPGHNPSQETKCVRVGKRDGSKPSSDRSTRTLNSDLAPHHICRSKVKKVSRSKNDCLDRLLTNVLMMRVPHCVPTMAVAGKVTTKDVVEQICLLSGF